MLDELARLDPIDDRRRRVDGSRPPRSSATADDCAASSATCSTTPSATPHGVAVELRRGRRQPTLVVDDDGPGIADDRRAEVFERFARGSTRHAPRGPGGAGLGLAIVHDLVARHGGTVIVTDGPLGGARFVVTLRR